MLCLTPGDQVAVVDVGTVRVRQAMEAALDSGEGRCNMQEERLETLEKGRQERRVQEVQVRETKKITVFHMGVLLFTTALHLSHLICKYFLSGGYILLSWYAFPSCGGL
jgi:hypothetical protein